jgi:cytoskeleton protein RodZ
MEHADHTAGVATKARAGDRLRAAREQQRLTIGEVSIRTRVPKRMLEAIEAGDHAALPAPTYSTGFVKAYAQVLGLDPGDLGQQFRADLGGHAVPQHRPEPFAPADPARVPSRLLALVALAVAILIAAGYGVWRSGMLSGEGADDRARLAAGTDALPPAAPDPVANTPAAVDPAAVATPAAAAGPVALTATAPVWVRIYERSGQTLFTGEMAAGQRFEVPTDAVDPLIHTGRAEALRVTVGTTEIPPLGPPSTRLRDVPLARDALLARANAPGGAPAADGATNSVLPLVPQGSNP